MATGRDGLLQWFEKMQPPEQRGKHITANPVVDVDGDHALAVSDFVFRTRSEGRLIPPSPAATATSCGVMGGGGGFAAGRPSRCSRLACCWPLESDKLRF